MLFDDRLRLEHDEHGLNLSYANRDRRRDWSETFSEDRQLHRAGSDRNSSLPSEPVTYRRASPATCAGEHSDKYEAIPAEMARTVS